jgi:hypothetical protein
MHQDVLGVHPLCGRVPGQAMGAARPQHRSGRVPGQAMGAARPQHRREFLEVRKRQHITFAFSRCNKRAQSHVFLITNPCFSDYLVILIYYHIATFLFLN